MCFLFVCCFAFVFVFLQGSNANFYLLHAGKINILCMLLAWGQVLAPAVGLTGSKAI